MSQITRLHAREVLDSRGNPTVEVEVHCANGVMGRAIVPSGASTGKHEAEELRDGDAKRFDGKGVLAAVRGVNGLHLRGVDPREQSQIDDLLCGQDAADEEPLLGANGRLGVSLAVAHAAAASEGLPLWKWLGRGRTPKLPMPMVNMISGGLHAGGNLDFQDFLLLPRGASTYSEALLWSVAVYRKLGEVLRAKGYEGTLVGDEGGYGPRLRSNEEAFELILEAINRAGLTPGHHAAIAIDVASSHFYDSEKNRYLFHVPEQVEESASAMVESLAKYCVLYHVKSIEDGLAEDDWEGWQLLTERLGNRVQLIGDDLFVTNPERLKMGIEKKVANSILIKVNQIGTLTETLQVIDLARANGYRPVISARSGETEDSTIADLAVATGAGQIKIGSVARSERLAKYNQLLRIEEELPGPEHFAGWQPIGKPIG